MQGSDNNLDDDDNEGDDELAEADLFVDDLFECAGMLDSLLEMCRA